MKTFLNLHANEEQLVIISKAKGSNIMTQLVQMRKALESIPLSNKKQIDESKAFENTHAHYASWLMTRH